MEGLALSYGGPDSSNGRNEIAFESYGVRLAIAATSADLLERMRPLLPPGWTPCPASQVRRRFGIAKEETGTYAFTRDGLVSNQGLGLELALELLDTELRLYIARKAPDTIFIHAGVVAHNGRTLVIPGMSFSGKTRLVAALVRQGAVYFSDEFAVLDYEGLVHPYAKPLSVRNSNQIQIDHDVDALGGVAGDEALRIGAIVVTTYKPGASWQPQELSAGEGAMALLANAVPARERPTEVMRAISRAADGAVVIKSDRSEADEIAPFLLAALDRVAGERA